MAGKAYLVFLLWSSYHFQSSHHCSKHKDLTYFRGYAILSYQKKGICYDNIPIHFRIQRDHTIWFSIKSPWIHTEMVRGKITPQKIIVVNHRQRLSCTYDYTRICNQWGVACNYQLIQALLLRTLPFMNNKSREEPRSLRHKHAIVINEKQNNCQIEYLYHAIKKWLLQVTLKNNVTKNKFVITYKTHRPQQKIILMYDAQCTLLSTNPLNNCTIHIKLSKMHLRESSKELLFPFFIPTYYKQFCNKF